MGKRINISCNTKIDIFDFGTYLMYKGNLKGSTINNNFMLYQQGDSIQIYKDIKKWKEKQTISN